MANEEHVALLKQTVEVWNKWREEHLGIDLDLTEADLRGANLRWATLTLMGQGQRMKPSKS